MKTSNLRLLQQTKLTGTNGQGENYSQVQINNRVAQKGTSRDRGGPTL